MNAATETSDGWPGVIAQLDQRHRVVTCRDGIQWIIQRRKGGGAARPWYGVSYCVTRAALIRLCAALNPDVPPAVRALPAYFQRERQP